MCTMYQIIYETKTSFKIEEEMLDILDIKYKKRFISSLEGRLRDNIFIVISKIISILLLFTKIYIELKSLYINYWNVNVKW